LLGKGGYTPSALLDGAARAGYREFSVQNDLNSHREATMTRAELDVYREQLQQLRQRLNGDVSHLKDEALRRGDGQAGGNLSNMPLHMADLGTDAFEQEFTLSLLRNEELALDEITAALDRIDQGKFGRCEECGSVVPKARLQALPYTRYCVACARKVEQDS
jgi:RNA polymerase-binding transcription factor DksA